jgi:hypothetical protein
MSADLASGLATGVEIESRFREVLPARRGSSEASALHGREDDSQKKAPMCGAFLSGPYRDRTCDLEIKSLLLYQLS